MSEYEGALLKYLESLLTPRRRERFEQVLNWRTRWLTVVLTDLYQQHNISAVLRSCDAFGVQDVHVIEDENAFETNSRIARGSERWLTLHRHRGAVPIQDCLRDLRRQGYVIAATVPGENHRSIEELPVTQPVALLFGTEKEGLPPEVLAQADALVRLPMFGFVESFNVSVAAALSLQLLTRTLHASSVPWHLTKLERERLRLDWSRQSLPGAEAIEHRFQSEWRAAESELSASQKSAIHLPKPEF